MGRHILVEPVQCAGKLRIHPQSGSTQFVDRPIVRFGGSWLAGRCSCLQRQKYADKRT